MENLGQEFKNFSKKRIDRFKNSWYIEIAKINHDLKSDL